MSDGYSALQDGAQSASRMSWEKYEKQYSRQVEWLEAVQSSAVMLDLPTVTGPNGEEDYHNPIRTGEESETIISGKTWEIKRKETSRSGT